MTKIFILALVMGLLLSFVLFMNADTHAYTNLGGGVCECNSAEECTEAMDADSCNEIRLAEDLKNIDGTFADNPANFKNKILDCQDHLIEGRGTGNGIYLNGKNNNIIRNCRIEGFYTGIRLLSSSGNIFENNRIDSNAEAGFYLDSSQGNEFTGNTANKNKRGFHFVLSDDNSFTNNAANSNSEMGFFFFESKNNFFKGNNANLNKFGFYFGSNSNSNDFVENTASSNAYSGFKGDAGIGNTFKGNTASLNAQNGIYLSSSQKNTLSGNTLDNNGMIQLKLVSSPNNEIYNNIFDASEGQETVYSDSLNSWNTVKTPQANILGRQYTGGNFYSDYTGEDSDGDGLGDAEYSINEGNIDYYPMIR